MWTFIKSATNKNNLLIHNQNEICFIGRSNVGKSTLINLLANNKIAKTSKTPGRTQLINYYQTDKNVIAVDLPGYGYAKMSKIEQEKMFTIIDEYFNNVYPNIVFLLIDGRIGMQKQDENIINYLYSLNHNINLIITKCDKANQKQISKTLKNNFFAKIKYFKSSIKNEKEIKNILKYIYNLS